MSRQLLGRCIGAAGATCSVIGCVLVVLGFITGLVDGGAMRIVLVVLWPIGVGAVLLGVLSMRVLVVLARRPDVRLPVQLAIVYGILGLFTSIWGRLTFPSLWFVLGLFAVAASEAVAARLCYQEA